MTSTCRIITALYFYYSGSNNGEKSITLTIEAMHMDGKKDTGSGTISGIKYFSGTVENTDNEYICKIGQIVGHNGLNLYVTNTSGQTIQYIIYSQLLINAGD